jgi:Rad9
MDCVIVGPASVKLFCSSISCLSKIGRDLYLEHDVASGVVLRALNDAKSAYCSMKFAPTFFERCSTTTTTTSAAVATSSNGGNASRRRRHAPASPSPSLTQTSNGVSVRMAMRAMLPVVKPRRDVMQLRITSVAENDEGESSSPLRLAFEFLVVRRSPDGGGGAAGMAAAAGGNRRRGRGTYQYDSHNSDHIATSADDTLIRIVHRIPASDADAVSAVLDASIVPSELACHPRTLLRLLEPLSRFKNVTEVALVIQKNSSVLTAQSFHHTDKYRVVRQVPKQAQPPQQISAAPAASSAPMLQWVQRERDASRVVKTEASMSVEELDRFAFQDDRQQHDDHFEEGDGDERLRDVPDHVNDGVVLVFPVKEARAFLQFGAAFASSTHNAASSSVASGTTSLDSAVVQFHWGGKPVVMELSSSRADDDRGDGPGHTPRDFFSPRAASAAHSSPFAARLVLASLDHKLLADSSADGNDNENENENDGENTMTTNNNR